MMQGLGAWPPSAYGLQQPTRLSAASKPHPARVCAAGVGWAVLVGYMWASTAEQNLALQHDALLAAGDWHRARTHHQPPRDDIYSGVVTNRSGRAGARAW